MKRTLLPLPFLALSLSLALAETAPPVLIGNLSPADALKEFETEPGLSVELVAAEPLVVDPVAMAWDERGRMFVAENRGYPEGGPDGQPVGVIALLEDTDGDGLPDKRTEFATGLTFPNGVLPWRGGLIVTCSPDVLWLADTNGDGRADVREVLLTGFETNKTTQLRVNDPTLGPDGWIYLAGGLSGGTIVSPKQPDRPLNLERTDLKFNPDTGALEPTDGKSQFGLAFDDAGHRFACFNRVQSQHAPLPARYLARNPNVHPPGVLQDLPALVENKLLTHYSQGASRYYPISANIVTADSHTGYYSAACAVHIARGDALPADYVGRAWSCDPTGNLVRSDRLTPAGGSFRATRVAEGTEALRSRDNWCRPVFLADGPDGALYVCDMYRKTIEHPKYLPGDVRAHTDFESGKGMGRLWRLRAANHKLPIPNFQFGKATPAELVAALDSPNGWIRDTAFRLLVERADPAAVPALNAELWKFHTTAGRLAALHLLAVFNRLTDTTLAAALTNTVAEVREVALRLAEPRLATAPALAALVYPLADDPAVHVRYQAALALGDCGGHIRGDASEARPRALAALARIAMQDADDPWFRAALQTSVRGPEAEWGLISRLLGRAPLPDGALQLLRELVRQNNAASEPWEIADNLDWYLRESAASGFEARAELLLGYAERGATPLQRRLARASDDPLVATFTDARRFVADSAAPLARRQRAVALLALETSPATQDALLALVRPGEPAGLQTAAVRALAQPQHASGVGRLLTAARWSGYTPALRGTVVSSLLNRPEAAQALVAALESGDVPAGALNANQREHLKKTKDPALRARAEKLFANVGGADRQQAYEAAKAALALQPAPENGHAVFTRLCAGCHRLNREGVAVGPDLFDIRNQPKETILLHLVIPEQEIAPNFTYYECVTKDDRSISGLLADDGATSITLRQAQGVEETVPRAQIARLTASALSLMPADLEKGMTAQELADLLGYLRGE